MKIFPDHARDELYRLFWTVHHDFPIRPASSAPRKRHYCFYTRINAVGPRKIIVILETIASSFSYFVRSRERTLSRLNVSTFHKLSLVTYQLGCLTSPRGVTQLEKHQKVRMIMRVQIGKDCPLTRVIVA